MPRKANPTSLSPDSYFITRKQAAEFLGLNLGAIDELIRSEKLPAYRPVGRRILIRRDELLAMVTNSPVWEKTGVRRG
jgi:excisionase family DNA binding protein